jgi:hypothetical protein
MTRDEILNMPAGREMDRIIADKVIKCHVILEWQSLADKYLPTCGCEPYNPKHINLYGLLANYSTDISAAWEVVEKMDEKFSFILECNNPPSTNGYKWFCELYAKYEPFIDYEVYSSTASLAICRVALLTTLE